MNRRRVSSSLAVGVRRMTSLDRESESLGLLSRVSHLNEILGNEHTSFTEKSRQCYNYYRNSHPTHSKQSHVPQGTNPHAKTSSLPTRRLNLISDVSRYRQINTDVIRRICYIFTKSSSMRAFLLSQILENIRQHDLELVISAYKLMEECLLLSEDESKYVSVLSNRIKRLRAAHSTSATPPNVNNALHLASNLLLSICMRSGESLLAVALAEECSKISPDFLHKIGPNIMHGILISLSIYDPLMHHYKSYAIFKMLRVFGGDAVPLDTYFKMISNMSVDAKNPFFVNVLYDRVMSDPRASNLAELDHAHLELYLPTLKNLIAINLHHGNIFRAADLWLSLHATPDIHTHFLKRNSVLLEAILHEFLSPDMYKWRKTVPRLLSLVDYEQHPHLLDFALRFYGEKPGPSFEDLVKLLKPPLGRSTLSALFSALLAQNKENAAERIMQTIFRTQRGLNSSDFEVIVKKLLSQYKISECIDMFRDTNFLVASKGSMHILTYLLRQKRRMPPERNEFAKISSQKGDFPGNKNASRGNNPTRNGEDLFQEKEFPGIFIEFINAFVSKMQRSRNSWQDFTLSLLRFISMDINNRVSRRIYEARAFEYPKDGPKSLNLHLLGLPQQLEQFVAIDMSNRVKCLLVIFKQAQSDNDQSVIMWCVDELRNLGVPVSDIERHFMSI